MTRKFNWQPYDVLKESRRIIKRGAIAIAGVISIALVIVLYMVTQ